MKVKKNTIILFFLFIISINLMAKMNYLVIALFIILIICNKKSNIIISLELILLAAFCVSYILINNLYYGTSIYEISYLGISPIIAYVLGSLIIDTEQQVKKVLFILAIGTSLYGIINYMTSISTGRVVEDFWTKIPMAATLQNILFIMFNSLLFYILFYIKNRIFKLIGISVVVFNLYISIQNASRTLIYMTILSFMINILLFLWINRNNKIYLIKMFSKLVLILFIAFGLFKFNFGGINDFYKKSPLGKRIEEINTSYKEIDPRYKAQKTIITNILNNPYGNKKIEIELQYAHNLWLDVIWSQGLIIGGILVLYSLLTLRVVFKLMKKKAKIDNSMKHLIFSIVVGLNIGFMFEPILEGAPYIFICLVLINGMIKKLEYYNKNTENIRSFA